MQTVQWYQSKEQLRCCLTVNLPLNTSETEKHHMKMTLKFQTENLSCCIFSSFPWTETASRLSVQTSEIHSVRHSKHHTA